MAVYRVDWPFIRDNLLDAEINPASKEIVLLPVGGRQILASVIGDRLHWKATYRTGDYDYSDWDTLEAIGAATVAGLLDGIMLQDLLAELDQIEAAIIASSCCPVGEPVTLDYETVGPIAQAQDPTVGVGTGSVPTPFTTNPNYTADWDGFAVYLCDAAYRVAAGIERALTYLQTGSTLDLFGLARQLVGPVLQWAIPGQVDDWLIWAWDELYTFASNIGSWITGTPTAADYTTIRNLWDAAVRQDVLCAISQAVDNDAAAADVRTLMQSLYNSATWDAIWAVYPFERIMARIFQGGQEYEGPTQNCTCVPEPPFLWTFDAGVEGWFADPGDTASLWDASTQRLDSNPNNEFSSPTFELDGSQVQIDWYHQKYGSASGTCWMQLRDAGTKVVVAQSGEAVSNSDSFVATPPAGFYYLHVSSPDGRRVDNVAVGYT